MEETAITDNFRLIAYDLPYHGKSLPPSEKDWWAERYALEGDFLRSIPLKLSAALNLDQPVFVGCSVGGLLALDLAHKHADAFRAVVSVEGALNIPGALKDLGDLWHPKISNDFKARMMEGLMSPEKPALCMPVAGHSLSLATLTITLVTTICEAKRERSIQPRWLCIFCPVNTTTVAPANWAKRHTRRLLALAGKK